MELVRFFVKRDTDNNKSVHSICRTTKSTKFVFPQELRDPRCHMPGVSQKISETQVTKKVHVKYTLKGKEVPFYFNVASGKFHFNGTNLKEVPASAVSNDPSEDKTDSEDDVDDEEVANCFDRPPRLNETVSLGDSRFRRNETVSTTNSRSRLNETISATSSRSRICADKVNIVADPRTKQKVKKQQACAVGLYESDDELVILDDDFRFNNSSNSFINQPFKKKNLLLNETKPRVHLDEAVATKSWRKPMSHTEQMIGKQEQISSSAPSSWAEHSTNRRSLVRQNVTRG